MSNGKSIFFPFKRKLKAVVKFKMSDGKVIFSSKKKSKVVVKLNMFGGRLGASWH